MDEMKYEKVGDANSRAEADVIESFLEAEGIDVELIEESISRSAYGFSSAHVEIYVPKEQAELARQLLVPFDDVEPEKEDEESGENE